MKLPPYARAIKSERDRGAHPPRIWVIFGDDWARRPQNSVCVRPGDYQQGVYDWSVCAGVPVHVVERTPVLEPSRDAVRLTAEIARHTAPVVLHWIAEAEDWPLEDKTQQDIGDIMAYVRPRPRWWSKAVEKTYLQRSELYFTALRSILRKRLGAVA